MIYDWVSFSKFPQLQKFETRRFSNHESRLLLRAHTFAIIVILDLKIHQSMWIHWSSFPKTWTKGHWPLHDLWPHVCWGHMCDSTQGSLCPSPMTIHQCMWIQWSIWQITTYIHILHAYILHTTYRMSDHIVSYWTQFRRDKKLGSFYKDLPKSGQRIRYGSHYLENWYMCQLSNFPAAHPYQNQTAVPTSFRPECTIKWRSNPD